eukprot:TRINITY_DN10706_c0_g1_i3.p1 TRINITY_DN10706_c0_g1~~TRINITY_DN10706_c0_g1_i3.p1  ORF type:complete len:444 (-),score=93.70 TRINITY_DN10706_c0_g1_i3:139-1299(-)
MWARVSLLLSTSVVVGCAYGSRNPESALYPNVIMPVVRLLDPESLHRLGVLALRFKWIKNEVQDDPVLVQQCWGKKFNNPIGLAAGFDKHAEALPGLSALGFGFVEVGSVTPEPQLGNDRPRVFRLVEDDAIINRYGCNSHGFDVVQKRLENWRQSPQNLIVGVNLAKNKTSTDSIADYTLGVHKLSQFADYLVINISSPNTPNLRDLQHDQALIDLYRAVREERDAIAKENPTKFTPPLLIKIAPDLTIAQKESIARAALDLMIDGIIVSNTTVSRENLINKHANETGGLSGKPLTNMSTALLKDMYVLTKGTIPLVGVGGIFTGQDALDKIEAGASLVQIYTSLALEGPGKVVQIKRELTHLLKEKGYSSVQDAVGAATEMRKE